MNHKQSIIAEFNERPETHFLQSLLNVRDTLTDDDDDVDL